MAQLSNHNRQRTSERIFSPQTHLVTSNTAVLLNFTLHHTLACYRLLPWRQLDLFPCVLLSIEYNCFFTVLFRSSFLCSSWILQMSWRHQQHRAQILKTIRPPSHFVGSSPWLLWGFNVLHVLFASAIIIRRASIQRLTVVRDFIVLMIFVLWLWRWTIRVERVWGALLNIKANDVPIKVI